MVHTLFQPIRMANFDATHDIHKHVAGFEDSDGETPMAERVLAEDAQWKLMQRNTFTRWVNEHLKKANVQVENIDEDFSNGLKLATLIEVLANHKFKNLNKKLNFRTQKLENVTMVLKFLEEHEKLRLVSIGNCCMHIFLYIFKDSSHIVDGNSKLIFGLIWKLILHYSISIPMGNDSDEVKQVSHFEKKNHG